MRCDGTAPVELPALPVTRAFLQLQIVPHWSHIPDMCADCIGIAHSRGSPAMSRRVALPFIDDRVEPHVSLCCIPRAANSTVHDVANLNSPVPGKMLRRFGIDKAASTAKTSEELSPCAKGLDSDLLDILRRASEVYEASDEVMCVLKAHLAPMLPGPLQSPPRASHYLATH
jgi:hypothetical protein